jgi:bla regulator protein blaR1
MNEYGFIDLFLRSIALAALVWLALGLFPRGHSVREFVLLAGFACLGLLAIGVVAPLPRVQVPALSVPIAHSTVNIGLWITAVWMAGVAIALSREVLAGRRLRGIVKSSLPAGEALLGEPLLEAWALAGLRFPVEVRVAGRFGPAATGCWRRIILLPESSATWDAATLRYVLAHELTHFRHQDPLKHLCVRLVCALQWFNPFVYLLRQALEAERELACDRLAMQAGDAVGYGECLLSLAEHQIGPPMQVALSMGATRGRQLEWRIRHLFRESPRLRAVEIAVLATLLVLLAACSFVSPFAGRDNSQWTAGEVEQRLTAEPFPGNP